MGMHYTIYVREDRDPLIHKRPKAIEVGQRYHRLLEKKIFIIHVLQNKNQFD